MRIDRLHPYRYQQRYRSLGDESRAKAHLPRRINPQPRRWVAVWCLLCLGLFSVDASSFSSFFFPAILQFCFWYLDSRCRKCPENDHSHGLPILGCTDLQVLFCDVGYCYLQKLLGGIDSNWSFWVAFHEITLPYFSEARSCCVFLVHE